MQIATRYGEIHWERTEISLSDEIINLSQQIERDKHNPSLWLNIAQAYVKQQLFREAVESVSLAISFDAFHAELYIKRGEFLMRLARFEEAASDFSTALTLEPLNTAAGVNLGICSYFMARYHVGIDTISKSLLFIHSEDSISYQTASLWIWRLLVNLDKRDEAVAQIRQAVQKEASDQDIENMLCKLYADMYTVDMALAFMNNISSIESNLKVAAGIMVYLIASGMKEKAKEIYLSKVKVLDNIKVWHTLDAHLIRLAYKEL